MALSFTALPVALVTIGWGWYGRSAPRQHASVSAEEIAELDSSADDEPRPLTLARLGRIAANHDVLLLAFSYFCMNYTFYLLTYWSFLYLVQMRHFKGIESGIVGTVPWIGAAIGASVGGFLSDWLAERCGARWGYRIVPLISLPLAGALLLLTIGVSRCYSAVLTPKAPRKREILFHLVSKK